MLPLLRAKKVQEWLPYKDDDELEPTAQIPAADPRCPRCKGRLRDHAEEDLFSCLPCRIWYRQKRGQFVETSVQAVDTSALRLPWRHVEEERG